MTRFIRHHNNPDNNACTCGVHQSGLECKAAAALTRLGVTYIYEDLDEDFTGYVPDFRILAMPEHLEGDGCAPAYVEIKPRKFIRCAMEVVGVTNDDINSVVGENRGYWECSRTPQEWEQEHSHEMAKIQAFVDHFNDEYGWNRPILVTEAIGEYERTSMLVSNWGLIFSRVNPLVSYGAVCGDLIRKQARANAAVQLGHLVDYEFAMRTANLHEGRCCFCKVKVNAYHGVRSDYKTVKGWRVICYDCINSARRY